MDKILVLLSTYNGEKYLREQLDSILAQTGVEITILVRDDGSTDGTTDILNKYHHKFPDKIIVNLADNIGCTGSFFALMKLASEKYNDYDYYAFSDQDDVWLPEKMSEAARSLDTLNNSIKLYYCSPKLVDQDLNPLKSTPIHAKSTLEESIILQPCIGCSMVFSKGLLNKASIIDPEKVDIHDTWTYRVCLALGGEIACDPTPHILYRQHGTNAIGGRQGYKRKWERRIKKFFNSERFRSGQTRLILHTYGSEVPKRERKVLSDLSNYHNSLKKKLKIIFNKDYSTNYRMHNLMFRMAILFGKI